MDANWTKERPKENGWYWFYGDPFSQHGDPERGDPKYVRVYLVKVKAARCIYVVEGNFMENKNGWWMPAELPEPPQIGA